MSALRFARRLHELVAHLVHRDDERLLEARAQLAAQVRDVGVHGARRHPQLLVHAPDLLEQLLARHGAPAVLDDMAAWTNRMRALAGPGGLDQLRPDSLRYGMLMRKYQIEAYRREVPYGGYVITVLRDIPNCSMGFRPIYS